MMNTMMPMLMNPNMNSAADGGAPALETATSGWSAAKYANGAIPSYVPPESFVIEGGRFLDALLARCRIHDATRLIEQGTEASYFGDVFIRPQYDEQGNRTNTPQALLGKMRLEERTAIQEMLAKHRTILTGRAECGGLASGKEIAMKYYFKPAQMRHIGALFGARGEIHKKLVRESGCSRIEYAGRGITNRQKKINLDRGVTEALENEDPHAKIVAPTEAALNAAVQKIEWWLSESDDAQDARDEIQRQLAIRDGTYDPATFRPRHAPGTKRDREGQDGPQGGAEASGGGAQPAEDKELDAFLDDI